MLLKKDLIRFVERYKEGNKYLYSQKGIKIQPSDFVYC